MVCCCVKGIWSALRNALTRIKRWLATRRRNVQVEEANLELSGLLVADSLYQPTLSFQASDASLITAPTTNIMERLEETTSTQVREQGSSPKLPDKKKW